MGWTTLFASIVLSYWMNSTIAAGETKICTITNNIDGPIPYNGTANKKLICLVLSCPIRTAE